MKARIYMVTLGIIALFSIPVLAYADGPNEGFQGSLVMGGGHGGMGGHGRRRGAPPQPPVDSRQTEAYQSQAEKMNRFETLTEDEGSQKNRGHRNEKGDKQ